ncbi:MAG: thiolase domain-containing protein, partial [Acidilobaceae archaeon]
MRVAVIGIGYYGFKPSVPDLSFREMMFEAAMRAYYDANVDARRDIDVFISCQEDFWEGIAISDEFAPEPIGGVLRPTMTITGDGLQCIGQAYMIIKSGLADIVAVEAHAKPSDIESIQEIYELSLDPQVRTLNIANPLF